MRWQRRQFRIASSLLLLGALSTQVLCGEILQTNGFSSCGADADIRVDKMNIKYNKATNQVTFDVAGTSNKVQEVTATLTVLAFGQQIYQKDFDPCDAATKVDQLCPVPSGSYSASGSQAIPSQYANLVPDIAFNVPDLDGTAKLELKARNGGQQVACIQSNVGNGKSVATPAVPILAAGIAGGALVVSGISALGAGGYPGATAPSPTFMDVIGWFQSMALNGMMSVNYPPVYHSFAKNFAFSSLLIPWDGLETTIDKFRKATGGNLTNNSVQFLRNNATIVYSGTNSTATKRSIQIARLVARADGGDTAKTQHYVKGIQAYVEPLVIPKADTFMTVLLVFSIIIASIIVGILLFKLILELWGMFGRLPRKLEGFRERYWWVMAKTITNLILALYGIWTLYCVYQFTQGDSWAAKALAGVTLALFTAVLAFFSYKIWSLARMYKAADGDASALYDNKETWRNYSIFYENYKKSYWWLFIPIIIYSFVRGVIIAAGDGHGLAQTGAQLALEAIMLIILLALRPYQRKSGNWIGITIQVVRVLSVVCILIFVEQIGVGATPKAITGVVLVAMQSALTGLLAILIAVNGLLTLCKTNPYKKARRDAEKNRADDTLTPLDARNSLLISPSRWRISKRGVNYGSQQPTYPRTYVVDERYQTRQMSNGSLPSMRAPLLPQVELPRELRIE